MDEPGFPSQYCADQLKALSEPLRLKIVDVLLTGEKTVGDIAELIETELVTVSHHLGILKNAHLVESRRDGRFIIYRLRDDLVKPRGKSGHQLDLGCCRLDLPNT